jgi:hypothetical protein
MRLSSATVSATVLFEEHTSSLQTVLLQVLALFRAADTDGSETLDRAELAAVLRKLCAPLRCNPFGVSAGLAAFAQRKPQWSCAV